MIPPETRFRIARVPLSRIVVNECQPRYPDRVSHYVTLLSDPAHSAQDTGHVALTPLTNTGGWFFALLDGHHRYVAHIITGRADVLAIIHYSPGQPGYDELAHAPDRL